MSFDIFDNLIWVIGKVFQYQFDFQNECPRRLGEITKLLINRLKLLFWGDHFWGLQCTVLLFHWKEISTFCTLFVKTFQAREKFVAKVMREKYPHELNKKTISTEEMSDFYKTFLDAQWSSHLNYNLEWQKRNFTIAALSILVGFENLFKRRN